MYYVLIALILIGEKKSLLDTKKRRLDANLKGRRGDDKCNQYLTLICVILWLFRDGDKVKGEGGVL